MSAKSNASVRFWGSDLAKADAHKVKASEYDELPELTDDMLVRATVKRGGRPRSESPKVLLSVRYSREVVKYFRETGESWQARMDGVLREYVAQHSR